MVNVKNSNMESRRMNREMQSHATSVERYHTCQRQQQTQAHIQDAPHNTMSATK